MNIATLQEKLDALPLERQEKIYNMAGRMIENELQRNNTGGEFDDVQMPEHYNSHPSGVECIEICEHFNFNIGNAIKYLWRYAFKPDKVKELNKASWYVNKEINRLQDKMIGGK